ncbi:MAG: lactate/malate family dehydrogenase [Collinsella sp.]
MYQTRKIGVVGQGHVGAHVANSLLMQGIADELYLCDINEAKVTSEVQDLRDSLSFVPITPRSSTATTTTRSWPAATSSSTPPARSHWPPATATASCSLPPTPPALCQTHRRRRLRRHLRRISNPCDVVCTELWHLTGYDPRRSSARLRPGFRPPAHRDLQKVGVSPKSIDAYMIGEHGFSQLAAFRPQPSPARALTSFRPRTPTSTPSTTWRSRSLHARAAM